MHTSLAAVLRGIFRRFDRHGGQAEGLVIALVVLILILLLTGRRVLVQ